jgi:hypothetical protein
MNDWNVIFLMYNEDIDTDDELELFSESDSDQDTAQRCGNEEDYKQTLTKKSKLNI